MTRSAPGFRLRVLGTALFALAAAAVFLYFLSLSGVNVVPAARYTVHASVPDAVSLSDHADVLEAGVRVGTVQGVEASSNGVVLTLSLDGRYGPVYRDAEVELRSKTLMGEQYVDLAPGNPRSGAVASGGTLATRAPEAVQLDEILSTLDSAHRRDVQRILDVLGGGLRGRGPELNGLLGAGSDLVDKAAPVTAVLARDRAQLASLVDDLGTVTASLGGRASEIRTLVGAARAASSAVAMRDRDLRAVFREAPGFLDQARRSVTHLGSFSAGATPVVSDLRVATAALVPAVRELRPAAEVGTAIVDRLGPFATAATGAVRALQRVAPPATSMLAPLEAVLRQLNPMLAYVLPYTSDMGSVFQTMRETTEFHDASGGVGRVSATLSQLLTGVSPSEDDLIAALKKTGALSSLFSNKQYNPYPPPRSAGHRRPFSGMYPRVQADPPYRLSR